MTPAQIEAADGPPKPRQMHMRWTTDSGVVLFEFPSDLSQQDADDISQLLSLTMKGVHRRAAALTRANETGGDNGTD